MNQKHKQMRKKAAQIYALCPPALRRQIDQAADSVANVLLTGGTGSGKTAAAYVIHCRSPRSNQPCIHDNCAAIPDNLFESILFGHEKGAFTNAVNQRVGIIEQAQGGTLILDEFTEIPVELQAKCLTAVEEKRIRRVGGTEDIFVNVRFICATNQDVTAAIRDHKLRIDLYYRINVLSIVMPPLRDRREDIPTLASQHLEWIHAEEREAGGGHARLPLLDKRTIAELCDPKHHWNGNLRELRDMLHRAYIKHGAGGAITTEDLAGC